MKATRLALAIFWVVFMLDGVSAFPTPDHASIDHQQKAASQPTTVTPAHAGPADISKILYIEVGDLSGSMKTLVGQLRAAEAEQLKTLQPGDVLVRIEFDAGEARVVSLVQVRDAIDIDNALKIDLGQARGAKTEISRGLMKARSVALSHAGGRKIALVLATDGELDPRDSLRAERERLVEITGWWKARKDTVTILVAPDKTVQSSKAFLDLADQLGAKVVPLDDFAANSVAVREVTAMRAPVVEQGHDAARQGPVGSVMAGIALLILVGFVGVVVYLLWHRRVAERSPSAGTPEEPQLPKVSVHIRATVCGATRETSVEVSPDNTDAAVTIGGPGSIVELPGYRGAPITIAVDGVRGELAVPGGVGAWIGADRVQERGGHFNFLHRTSLRTQGAHIAIALVSQEGI